MSAGLPVITSKQNGASELIQEGVNGTVVDDPSDKEKVIDAIIYWSSHRYTMHTADLNPLRLDRNVAETIRVLEKAAGERKGRAR